MSSSVLSRSWRLLTLALSSASKLAILALVLVNFALASLTVAVVLSDWVFEFVSSIVGEVTDSTVWRRHERTRAELDEKTEELDVRTKELDAERQNTARLETELETTRRQTADLSKQLDRERTSNQALTTQKTELERNLKAERTKYDDLDLRTRTKAAADAGYYRNVANGFRSRGQRMAAANVAATFAEAIPVFGVAIIVGATGYEIAETCAMMRDMDALASRFDGQPIEEAGDKYCGVHVPSADEVWTKMTEAPTVVWEGVRRKLPGVHLPPPPKIDWGWFWDVVDLSRSYLPDFASPPPE